MGGLQLNGVELNGVFSCVESTDIHAIAWIKITCSRGRIMDLDLKDPMPYGWIDEWVFSYDGRYVTGWIMGLR
jgi:hypothetical protein